MKKKANRLDAIKMIISSKEVGSQEELLQELGQEGFELTQATLSRDLKQLKVAKAASMNGKYVYVLPNDIMYKRVGDQSASEMLMNNGFISLQFSGNIAVIKTRPGYASSMAYDIDNRESDTIWEQLPETIPLCWYYVKGQRPLPYDISCLSLFRISTN